MDLLHIKKVFEKYFFINDVEKYNFCIYCGDTLTGSKRKFCSQKCNDLYWRKIYSRKLPKDYICIPKINAEQKKIGSVKIPKNQICELCQTKKAEHIHYVPPLEYSFLCPKCHHNLHSILNKHSIQMKGGNKNGNDTKES